MSLLPLILIFPLAGAIVTALLPNARAAKTWALLVTLATAVLGIMLAAQFDWKQDLGAIAASDRLSESFQINFGGPVGPLSILVGNQTYVSISLGVDAISLVLVLLTVGLMPLAILSSFESIKQREKEYYAAAVLRLL
jgi:NADH:ubiquinone oxidoreductase subunit 4 (subunit M)